MATDPKRILNTVGACPGHLEWLAGCPSVSKVESILLDYASRRRYALAQPVLEAIPTVNFNWTVTTIMLSIFDVVPRVTGSPTVPLKMAVDKLKLVAEQVAVIEAQEAKATQIRDKYISKVLPGASRPQFSVEQFKVAIRAKISGAYGKKGPTENAFNALDHEARRAEQAGYSLKSSKLQDAFMNYLMLLVTEGFIGEDTTGTQIGNHIGGWRGGGFGDK